MLEIFVIFLICAIAIWGIWAIWAPSSKPHEVEWGDGKDLSALAIRHKLPLPNSPFEELEEWWYSEESKDARIKELESELYAYETRTYKLYIEIAQLEEKLRQLKEKDRKDFLSYLTNGPARYSLQSFGDIPDNTTH